MKEETKQSIMEVLEGMKPEDQIQLLRECQAELKQQTTQENRVKKTN